MHLKSIFCALLLTQLTTGCATYFASDIGRNRDGHEEFTKVYADGKQITVCYSNPGQEGDASRRWAKVYLADVKWIPIGNTTMAIRDMTQPQEFMPHSGSCKPEAGAGLKEISFYYSPDWESLEHSNPESAPISLKDINEGVIHRQDSDRLPFTAYGGRRYDGRYKKSTLVLIRDDPAHPGQLQAAALVSSSDANPMLRWVTYPFSIAVDVVTLPLQLLVLLRL